MFHLILFLLSARRVKIGGSSSRPVQNFWKQIATSDAGVDCSAQLFGGHFAKDVHHMNLRKPESQ